MPPTTPIRHSRRQLEAPSSPRRSTRRHIPRTRDDEADVTPLTARRPHQTRDGDIGIRGVYGFRATIPRLSLSGEMHTYLLIPIFTP
jgi:hypothetical protein